MVGIFEQIFRERGPPNELLLYNSSLSIKADGRFVRKVEHVLHFSISIIERNHRTIKSLAARTGRPPLDVLFWYNSAPLEESSDSVPAAALHTYSWRNPNVERV